MLFSTCCSIEKVNKASESSKEFLELPFCEKLVSVPSFSKFRLRAGGINHSQPLVSSLTPLQVNCGQ